MIEDIQLILSNYHIESKTDKTVVFTHKKGCLLQIMHIVIVFVFPLANFLIALAELVLIAAKILPEAILIVIAIHLVLIYFAWYILWDMPPDKITIKDKKLVICRKKFFFGTSENEIDLSLAREINLHTYPIRGTEKTDIYLLMSNGKKILLFRLHAPEEEKINLLKDYFTSLMQIQKY